MTKKSNQSLRNNVAIKDFLNTLSAPAIILITVYAVMAVYLILAPYSVPGEDGLIYGLTSAIGRSQYDLSDANSEPLLSLVFAVILAYNQFDFLLKKNLCNTVLSFGISRKRVFLNRYLLPITAMTVIMTVLKLIAFGMNCSINGFSTELLILLATNLAANIMIIVTSYTATVAGCLFGGRRIGALLGSASLITLPMALSLCISTIIEYCLPGFDNAYELYRNIISYVDPLTAMSYTAYFESADLGFSNKESLLFAACSIGWIVISILASALMAKYFENKFKAENSEMAGKNTVMNAICCFSLPALVGALIFSIYIDNFFPFYTTGISVTAIVIRCVATVICAITVMLILTRSFKKLKPALISSAVSVAILAVTAVVCFTSVFGLYSTPPAVDEIKSVTFNTPFSGFTDIDVDTFGDIYTETYAQIEFTEEKDFEIITSAQKNMNEPGDMTTSSKFSVEYTLKNGKKVKRNYNYTDYETLDILLALWDSEAVKEYYKSLIYYENTEIYSDLYDDSFENRSIEPIVKIISLNSISTDVTNKITQNELKMLQDAVYKDICTVGYKEWFYPTTKALGRIEFTDATRESMWADSAPTIQITESCVNTINALKKLGLYDYLEVSHVIKKAYIVNGYEFVRWNNPIDYINKYKSPVNVHFIPDPFIAAWLSNEEVKLSKDKLPSLETVTDSAEIEALIEKSYHKGMCDENDCLLMVEYESEVNSDNDDVNICFATYLMPQA